MNSSKSEAIKSALIGLAALVALIAWLKFQPRLPDMEPQEKIGKILLDRFSDISAAAQIEFVCVDPSSGEPKSLRLSREKDAWTIPSMLNYPAENPERLAKVLSPLTQLVVLDTLKASNSSNSKEIDELHRECGLLNPSNFIPNYSEENESNLAFGSALAIKIDDESGERLVDLLVGTRAPQTSETRDARFVRFANDDVVYVVDFSVDSTQEVGTTEFTEYPDRISFEPVDWINPDLLRISRWNIKLLTVMDYGLSFQKHEGEAPTFEFNAKGVAVFKQTPDNSLSRVWSLFRRVDYATGGSWNELTAVNEESAQNDALNETADALARLRIETVRRKPDALRALFKSGNIGSALTSYSETLADLGFATYDRDPLDAQNIEPILVGEGGAIEATMKSGEKLSLIFGRKFDNMRICVVTAQFDKQALINNAKDEAEVAFYATDGEKESQKDADRFADWFYFVTEDAYETLRFRFSDVLK